MRPFATLLLLPLLSTLLAGCGGGGWANRSQPAWFEDREPLRMCTDVELDQDEFVPDDAASCLLDGGDDAGAELLVRTPTTEGDPTYTYYRRLPGAGGLDVTTDATQDKNGSDGWRWETCPDATSLLDLGECTLRATEPR